jgi:hypothetical protein
MSLRLSSRPRRRASTFRPSLETLEDRRVLSCTVSFSGTTLTITGDNTNNTVVINDNGANTPTFNGSTTPISGVTADPGTTLAVSVNCNGVTQNFPAAGATNAQLTTVLINMGKKKDSVTYNLSAGLRQNASRNIAANLGAGNDTFSLNIGATAIPNPSFPSSPTILSGLDQGSSLTLSANGGTGDDNLSVNATKAFDIGPNAAAVFNLLGGAGNDNIVVNVHASLSGPFTSSSTGTTPARAGSLTVLEDGGAGNDNVYGLLTVQGGNTTANVNGSGGNDNVGLVVNFDDTFEVFSSPQFQNPSRITAFLNGGGGHNSGFQTANVTATHVKPDIII